MLDPNTDYSVINDELLLKEFHRPKRYTKMHLYALMARRVDSNVKIKSRLFSEILSEKARKNIVVGSIKHSWIPAIYILQEGKDEIKSELRTVIARWSDEEKKAFLEYVGQNRDFYYFLKDI